MTRQPTAEGTELRCDVLVVGGGLGGVAAALAATDLGAAVVLTEVEDLLGGQLTTQLVACPDEHPLVESVGRTRSYARLRDSVRRAHRGEANPGGGWVSRLCAGPADYLRGIEDLLEPAVRGGRLVVLTGHRPVALLPAARPVEAVAGAQLVDHEGRCTTVRAEVTLDATETGDLLGLAGGWVIGSEGSRPHGEEHAVGPEPDPLAEQAVTWCAAVRLEHLAPWSDDEEAAATDSADRRFSLDLDGWDGTRHAYRFFTDGPDGRPPFWSYRRLVRGTGAAVPGSDARIGDVICLNWAGNDYAGSGLVADPDDTQRLSRELTLDFVEWLRTRCPRDDGGVGYPGLTLAPDVALSEDGLALAPYVRESRRLVRPDALTLHDLAPVPGSQRARLQSDAVALVWYHADLHARVGHPGSVYAPTAPAQVPLRSLVHPGRDGLLAAGKGIAATQVAAAATRVHPAEWAVGEAAGACAVVAIARGVSPGVLAGDALGVVQVQRALLERGSPVAWTADVADDDPDHDLLQLLLVHGGCAGARRLSLDLRPDDPLHPDDLRGLQPAAVVLGIDPVSASKALEALGPTATPREAAVALRPYLPDQPRLPETTDHQRSHDTDHEETE